MVKLKISSNILKWTSPGAKLSRSLHLSSTTTTSAAAAASATTTTTTTNATNQRKNTNKNPAKRWIHDDAMLVAGHVAYLVKFLGNIEVDQPKGLDTVRESIKKLEFQEHLKRSEGEKIRRIELTISIGGVAIREPKTKQNIYQFPLHRISYCADDKSDRKYLSFISKVQESSDRHECFVFVCDKLSEEIALTIGQAFDLAWKKFLEASGTDLDTRRELVQAKKRIQELERKVCELEDKLKENGRGSSLPEQNDGHNTTKTSFQTPPISPTTATTATTLATNQMIDLTMATNKLQSLIDLP